MEVTFSKQWIHFLLSDLWPPTSTILVEAQGEGMTKNRIKCKQLAPHFPIFFTARMHALTNLQNKVM